MRGPATFFLALSFSLAAGCASIDAQPTAAPIRSARWEVVTTPVAGPLPNDAAPAVTVWLRDGASERELPGRYLGALPFDGAVVGLELDGTLRRFVVTDRGELQSERIAEHVTSIPIVSPDGAHLAYVVSADGLTGSLRVLDAMGDREVTTPLGSIGALAFSPDGARVAFVGVAADGGIAGVWIADARGVDRARCLTNCELEAGDDLTRAMPLPADALRVEHQRITWIDSDGVEHEVRR